MKSRRRGLRRRRRTSSTLRSRRRANEESALIWNWNNADFAGVGFKPAPAGIRTWQRKTPTTFSPTNSAHPAAARASRRPTLLLPPVPAIILSSATMAGKSPNSPGSRWTWDSEPALSHPTPDHRRTLYRVRQVCRRLSVAAHHPGSTGLPQSRCHPLFPVLRPMRPVRRELPGGGGDDSRG